MKRIPIPSVLILIFLCTFLTAFSFNEDKTKTEEPSVTYAWSDQTYEVDTSYIDKQNRLSAHGYSREEVELLALLTMAEAEGETEYGKRLVVDTVLNRVDSPYFPNTIKEVIYQPYHFESIWNGRIERCAVNADILTLVQEEMCNRTNDEVIFFQTSTYSQYGQPLLKEGNHYFSTY